jgi:3-oxoacyl-[acyl-carrier-protein] synthase II
MTPPRIAVTGLGLVSPLGVGVEIAWRRLLDGQSGLRRLDEAVVIDVPAKIGGVVPSLEEDPDAGFNLDAAVPPKDQKKMDRFIQFALAAADEAIGQSGWVADTPEKQERTATVIATGIGGFPVIGEAVRTTDARGVRRLSPFTVPAFLANLASGWVSIRHGFKGPLGAPVTACAAGVQAIGDGARLIRSGEADVVICGGAEACIDRVSLGAFAAARALSWFQ